MIEDDRDVSKRLTGFGLRPAPAPLREKVLGAAAGARPAARSFCPAPWRMAAACGLIAIAAAAGDAVLSRTLAGRLDIVLSKPQRAEPAAGADGVVLGEILGAAQARALAAPSARLRRDRTSRWDGRGSWDESIMDVKEDADVRAKNPR